MFQNCLEQSRKHVCNGAYDRYKCMETRLQNDQRPDSNSLGCYYFPHVVVWMPVFVLLSCAT